METAPALDGDALRSARERAGFSQNDLARVLGLASGGRISLWERGEARPRSPQLLHALAAALATPVAELLESPRGGPTLRWLRFAAGLSVEDLALAAHPQAGGPREPVGGGGPCSSHRTGRLCTCCGAGLLRGRRTPRTAFIALSRRGAALPSRPGLRRAAQHSPHAGGPHIFQQADVVPLWCDVE